VLSAVQLASVLKSANIKVDSSVITYCQLGVRAAFVAAVLDTVGVKNVAVYDASMQEYSRSDLPIESDA
jgi:3-mercaptopyruvate sulfurtransferase SseA